MANYCVECGVKVDELWKYCPACGTQLPILKKVKLEKPLFDNLDDAFAKLNEIIFNNLSEQFSVKFFMKELNIDDKTRIVVNEDLNLTIYNLLLIYAQQNSGFKYRRTSDDALLVFEDYKVKSSITETNKHPRKVDAEVLAERLKCYRLAMANNRNVRAFYIFTNKAINSLIESRNSIFTKDDMLNIQGWGAFKVNEYGDDIINIINELDQNYFE